MKNNEDIKVTSAKSKTNLCVTLVGSAILIIGVALFLYFNFSLNSQAVAMFDSVHDSALAKGNGFESKFALLYSEAGLPSYYNDVGSRSVELRNECLAEFGISSADFELMINPDTTGDVLLGTHNRKELAEITSSLEENLSKIDGASDSIAVCSEIIENAVYSDIKVSFGQFNAIQKADYDYNTSMKLTIINKADMAHTFFFYVAAYDKNGELVNKQYVSTGLLSVGGKYENSVFTNISRSDIEKMRSAEFRIIELSEQ